MIFLDNQEPLKADLLLVKNGKLMRPSKDKLLISSTTDSTSTDSITSSDERSSKKKKTESIDEVER